MYVIISGATGSIGTALINECLDRGDHVLVITRESSKHNTRIPKDDRIEVVYCELHDFKLLNNTWGHAYDVFYHFAWAGTSGLGRNDMHMQNRNVSYALDAVEVAHRFGCHTFIGAGSQAEYGRVEGMLTSDTPTRPDMGYGIAKLCAGLMTRELSHQMDLKHIWVRVLSVYGPNDGKQSMIMSTIEKLQKGIVPEFTRGEQMWDYLYSKDAAKAFRLLAENGKDGKTYVLGSGKARPLAEYIEELRDVVAPNAQLAMGAIPYSSRQVMFLQADITEIQSDTGWEPEMSFREGIRSIIEHEGKTNE